MKKAIVVLGMHRSGTSSVAGNLVALGASAPKTLMPEHAKDNPKGYYESLALVKLNDQLLATAGSSWQDHSAFPQAWANTTDGQRYIETLAEAVSAEYGEAPLIVLKDPRICRLFPLWKKALHMAGYTPKILMPLRHPIEVASSLAKRERFTQTQGLLLWLRHVFDAEKETRKEDRVIILWEDFIQNWQKEIARASDRLGLDLWPASPEQIATAGAHLDPNLRRNRAQDIPVSPAFELVRGPYESLKALSNSPYSPQHLNRIDTLSREFEMGLRYVAPFAAEVGQVREQDILREREKYEACKANLIRELDRVSRRNATIKDLRAELETLRRGSTAIIHQPPVEDEAEHPSNTAAGTSR